MHFSSKNIKPLFFLILGSTAVLFNFQMVRLLSHFKGKEMIHWILFSSALVIAFLVGNQLKRQSRFFDSSLFELGLFFLFIILILSGAKAIFELVPFTFYFSGFALLYIVLTGLLTGMMVQPLQMKKLYLVLLSSAFGLLIFLVTDLERGHNQLLFLVAILMFFGIWVFHFKTRPFVKSLLYFILIMTIAAGTFFKKEILLFENQKAYEDQIVFHTQTQFHDLVITKWKSGYWIYLDELKNLATVDEFLYYEPMVHPAVQLAANKKKVLILGGENGCAIREVLKYPEVEEIFVVSYDTLLRNVARTHHILTSMNQNAYSDARVSIVDRELLEYISSDSSLFDIIFSDLPDPRDIQTNQFYTLEFFTYCKKHLNTEGIMVTQAGSPYFATKAFQSIRQSMEVAGFEVLPLHNQVLTLGEWGWLIGLQGMDKLQVEKMLYQKNFQNIPTVWLNQEAARQITSFGKTSFDNEEVLVNTLENPILYRIYLQGNWELSN